MNMYREMIQNSEPDTDPPEDFYVTAACGHEIYEGETLFEFEGNTYCPDCFREKIDDMELEELAAFLGCEFWRVRKK